MSKQKEKAYVIKNTAFILKLGIKCSPFSVFFIFFSYTVWGLFQNYVMGILFLKTALSIIEQNLDFREFAVRILFIVGAKLIIDLFDKLDDYYIAMNFAIKFEKVINNMIFNKAEQVELSCYDNPDFYNKFTRATWVIDKYANVNIIHQTAWAFSTVVSLIFMICYLITVNPFMLIFLITPVIVMIFRNLKNKIDFEKEKEMTPFERRKDYIKRTVLLKDFAKDIKTTNIFKVMIKYFTDSVNRNIEIIKKYGFKIAFLEMLCDFCGSVIPVGGGFAYSCYGLAVSHSIGLTDFSVIMSAIFSVRKAVMSLSNYVGQIQKYCFWVQSLREFLAYTPSIQDGEREAEDFKTLEFKNVSFAYPGTDKLIMQNVSFKINKGETTAVVGHNGAGKTTFSKLLMRLYDVTDGEILYNGINIKEYTLKSYREKFASVFQDYKIFAMTAAENVLTDEVNSENIKLAEKAVELSGIGNKFKKLPNGVNTIMTKEFDDSGTSLSGGETQKLSIAKLYAKNYDIAVLDEPSSALDPVAEAEMYKNLKTGTADKTVIYISHRLSSARDADNIFVFSDGQIIERGDHNTLMALKGEYEKMFTLQASGYREEEKEIE